jgi:hypothetical protein
LAVVRCVSRESGLTCINTYGALTLSFDLALVAHHPGVAEPLLQAFGRVPPEKRAETALVAFLEGRVEGAAQALDELGAFEPAAFMRLRGTVAHHADKKSALVLPLRRRDPLRARGRDDDVSD